MTPTGGTGLLVMAYGTPRDRDDIETYYTDVRRGRPPTPELLADLVRRYDAVLTGARNDAELTGARNDAVLTGARNDAGGGTFPLREITDRQVAALSGALGTGFTVVLGTKHSVPKIEDGVRELADRGVTHAIGLVLAPQFSAFSVGEYSARAAAAAREYGLTVDTVESWHLLPAYVSFLADAVTDALARMPGGSEVVFTAHSLPQRILGTGDPYPAQLEETARAVAAAADVDLWSVGWQSAGRTPEPWLGPDVLEIVRDRAKHGAPGVVVCACGFVADHLEVAYDLDIEAATLARELGLPFARTASVNDDPAVMRALAELISSR